MIGVLLGLNIVVLLSLYVVVLLNLHIVVLLVFHVVVLADIRILSHRIHRGVENVWDDFAMALGETQSFFANGDGTLGTNDSNTAMKVDLAPGAESRFSVDLKMIDLACKTNMTMHYPSKLFGNAPYIQKLG
jgi:hypothetical protein